MAAFAADFECVIEPALCRPIKIVMTACELGHSSA